MPIPIFVLIYLLRLFAVDNSRDSSSMDTINDLDHTQNRSTSSSELNGDMDIGIVREFSFTSSLQRMAVVTRKLMDKNFNVYCKGSPEMIQTLCKPVRHNRLILLFKFKFAKLIDGNINLKLHFFVL